MAELKINDKIKKLNDEVEWFYGEDFKLEEATKRYKDATKLVKEIESDLEKIKNEVKIIDEDFSKES